ncbi:MAG: MobA/MobL family protein [Lachnospiraceae bacterium]|nr:MobA/MobL family protein [Lachnospiraceae bacterium]
MALYHFTVTQVKRSRGKSSVASAAYIAGERIHDDYYGKTYDYRRKSGVLFSNILIPEHAPERLKDRATLWNEVESIEKHPKAQLCYNFNFALQNELSYEENKDIAERFIRDNFLAKGMIVDYAIHDPEKKEGMQNPHVHMLIPIRPLNKDGTWGEKQKRQYLYDDNGKAILDKKGKQKFNAVPTTDWGTVETLEQWRKAYADIFNEAFEKKGLACRIDSRSYEEQGLDKLPMIHEGPQVRAMELKGIQTEIGNYNRKVRKANEFIEKAMGGLLDIIDWIRNFIKKCKEEKIYMPALYQLVFDYYEKRYALAYSRNGRLKILKARMEVVNFITENEVDSFEGLSQYVKNAYRKLDELRECIKGMDSQIQTINEIFRYKEMYEENIQYIKRAESMTHKFRKEKYKNEHSDEFKKFYLARRKINEFWHGEEPGWSDLRRKTKELQIEREKKDLDCKNFKKAADNAYRIKRIAEDMMQEAELKEKSYISKRSHSYGKEL